jgi:hypothetical protein
MLTLRDEKRCEHSLTTVRESLRYEAGGWLIINVSVIGAENGSESGGWEVGTR